MSQPFRPCVRIDVPDQYYLVPLTVYEDLCKELDHGERGWREYPLFEHESARCFIRLESITGVGFYPAEWCEVKNTWESEERLHDG